MAAAAPRAGLEVPYPTALARLGAGFRARLVGRSISVLAGLGSVVLAVRLLGTDNYGVVAFALSVAGLIAGGGMAGIGAGTARAIANHSAAGETAETEALSRATLAAGVLIGVLGSTALFALLQFVPGGVPEGTRLWVGVGFALFLLGSVLGAMVATVARALGRVVAVELPNGSICIGRLLAFAVLLALGVSTLPAAAAAFGIVGLLAVVLCVRLSRRLVPAGKSPLRLQLVGPRRVLVLAAPFALVGLASLAISRLDVAVLGLTAPSADVGAYAPVARTLEQLSLLVPMMLISQYLPAATTLHSRGDTDGFAALFRTASKLAYTATLPAILLVAAFPETALHTLFGADFPVRTSIVWILLAGQLVNLAFGLNVTALQAIGDRRVLPRVGLAVFLAMTVLALALIPPFGAVGAAVATTA